jgi:GNAT superfamily N-acetyltransferase
VERSEITIDRVELTSAVARAAIAEAEAELDRRYGPGTNQEHLDPVVFEPPRGAFLVARSTDRLLGGVGLRSIGPGIGEIKRLWVDDGARRLGIGSALMAAAEAEAVALGMGLVVLETGPLQPEAVALYASQGWEVVDELPVRVSDYPNAIGFLKRYEDATRS